MDANKLLPGGPGGPERVTNAVIAEAASAAATGTFYHGHQTNQLKARQAESIRITDIKERQHCATLEVNETILNQGKTVT